jgi:hypothetical protein
MSLDDALAAIAAGEPVRLLAGYHQYQSDLVAVREGIADAAGLAGQPVIMGDDARAALRLQELAEAGWDLGTAGGQETLPEGGVDAWAAALVNGDVALSPILNRHRLPVAQANGSLILDRPVYGDDVLVTTEQALDDKPLALTAFVAGTVDALQQLLEPASDGPLYQAAEAAGMTITDPIRAGWANDLQDFSPWDGTFGEPDDGNGFGELDRYAAGQLGWVPPPADAVALGTLRDARVDAGLEDVSLPRLDRASGELRIDTASAELGDRAPLLLAQATDAFSRAGYDDVTLRTGGGIAAVTDGSADLAVVTAAEAAAAVDAGEPVVVLAGYQPAATEPTVLVASTDRDDLGPALQAYLRGLARLNLPDAFDRAVSQGGEAVDEGAAAAFDAALAGYAPFDGSTADPAAPVDPQLAAARASLGLIDPIGA